MKAILIYCIFIGNLLFAHSNTGYQKEETTNKINPDSMLVWIDSSLKGEEYGCKALIAIEEQWLKEERYWKVKDVFFYDQVVIAYENLDCHCSNVLK